ncbi:MAG: hypothetical protein KGJ23_08370 [Euryarchaeota archaeon]|nr:hypothetical protein [Euryarchaeota archaeon]MDE1836617.1 hypothetical protein [Euryarchaeota archaeon]MDE1879188.1 hypothetical protein [Euryarchaeota archaeon]MDE2044587.1 hypothetical protein [Thermoplasmata archaeon]
MSHRMGTRSAEPIGGPQARAVSMAQQSFRNLFDQREKMAEERRVQVDQFLSRIQDVVRRRK